MTVAEPSLKPVSGSALRLPARGRRRRDAVLATLLVVGAAALFGTWAATGDHARRVLVAARPIAAGQQFGADDLTARSVAGRGLDLLAERDVAQVVGKTAAVDVLPGTLLTSAMLTERTVPAAGEALVGVPLKAGGYPPELVAGMRVQAVVAGGDQPDAAHGPLAIGRVLSVQVDEATATTVVTLVVPADRASALAEAAAGGLLSLVVLPPGAAP